MPSTDSTRTINDIANWVATTALKRNDVIQMAQESALNFYRLLCFNVPFDELMTISSEIPVVASQDIYDLSVLVPALKSISDIRITFNSSTKRRLRRSHARVYDALSFSQPSKPATYARWGLKIQINPPPDSSSYTLRYRYWTKPTIATEPFNTQLATPEEWDELIRWETLYRVLNFVGQEQRAAMLIQPTMLPRQPAPRRQKMFDVGIIPRLWNELLSTISQKENVDEDFNINPVVRNYSYRGN